MKPRFALIPSGYKASTIYTVVGNDCIYKRTGNATRINEQGVIEELGAEIPRLDYSYSNCPVLLLEPTKTNLYLNSDTLVTQDVTTSATEYTVSFYGTGVLDFSGTHVGRLAGTGYNERVSLTFTPSAGTLTTTVTGDVRNAQIEEGYLTSYIPTTTATTRVKDVMYSEQISLPKNGVLYAEMKAFTSDYDAVQEIRIRNQIDVQRVVIRYTNATNQITAFVNDGTFKGVINYTGTDITDFHKIAYKYQSGSQELYVDGVLVGSATDSYNITEDLDEISSAFGNSGTSNSAELILKDLRVYDTLTAEEIKAL
jgi:hypothetical protein